MSVYLSKPQWPDVPSITLMNLNVIANRKLELFPNEIPMGRPMTGLVTHGHNWPYMMDNVALNYYKVLRAIHSQV